MKPLEDLRTTPASSDLLLGWKFSATRSRRRAQTHLSVGHVQPHKSARKAIQNPRRVHTSYPAGTKPCAERRHQFWLVQAGVTAEQVSPNESAKKEIASWRVRAAGTKPPHELAEDSDKLQLDRILPQKPMKRSPFAREEREDLLPVFAQRKIGSFPMSTKSLPYL